MYNYSKSTADVESLLSKYGFNEDISLNIRSIYMKKLLVTDLCQAYIEDEKSNLASRLVAVWVTCVVCGHDTSLITRSLSNYKQLSKYLVEPKPPNETDCFVWLRNFIENLGREFSNALTPADALPLKSSISCFFSQLIKTAEPILSEASDIAALKRLYDVTSFLVRTCAKAIYSKVRILFSWEIFLNFLIERYLLTDCCLSFSCIFKRIIFVEHKY